jgi:hypothetical protein
MGGATSAVRAHALSAAGTPLDTPPSSPTATHPTGPARRSTGSGSETLINAGKPPACGCGDPVAATITGRSAALAAARAQPAPAPRASQPSPPPPDPSPNPPRKVLFLFGWFPGVIHALATTYSTFSFTGVGKGVPASRIANAPPASATPATAVARSGAGGGAYGGGGGGAYGAGGYPALGSAGAPVAAPPQLLTAGPAGAGGGGYATTTSTVTSATEKAVM